MLDLFLLLLIGCTDEDGRDRDPMTTKQVSFSFVLSMRHAVSWVSGQVLILTLSFIVDSVLVLLSVSQSVFLGTCNRDHSLVSMCPRKCSVGLLLAPDAFSIRLGFGTGLDRNKFWSKC